LGDRQQQRQPAGIAQERVSAGPGRDIGEVSDCVDGLADPVVLKDPPVPTVCWHEVHPLMLTHRG